jgi:protein subunit release factor A
MMGRVRRLQDQVKELQYKLYDQDVLDQQEKVEDLMDELHQANKDGDYEKREELREELDEARAKLHSLKIDKAEDNSDQD